MPKGVTMPLIKTRAMTMFQCSPLPFGVKNYDDYQLRQLANELTHEIEKVTMFLSLKKLVVGIVKSAWY